MRKNASVISIIDPSYAAKSDQKLSSGACIVQDTVTTATQESIKINGAHVIVANVNADNGVMHIIDKVLVPQFMML